MVMVCMAFPLLSGITSTVPCHPAPNQGSHSLQKIFGNKKAPIKVGAAILCKKAGNLNTISAFLSLPFSGVPSNT